MRETVDAMPPDDQQLLLNWLTVGCGQVARAARLVLTDAPCGRILEMLTAAQAPLAGAVALLDGTPMTTPPDQRDPGDERAGLRALGWRDFLATQRPEEATVLRGDLEAPAHQARELSRAVRDDADTAHITHHLRATLAALGDLRGRLIAAVEP